MLKANVRCSRPNRSDNIARIVSVIALFAASNIQNEAIRVTSGGTGITAEIEQQNAIPIWLIAKMEAA